MITPAQRKQMKAVLNNQPTNPPSPHLTPAEKQELRTLIDAGREDDAWGELHYKSQAAIGNAMEAVMRKSREIEKPNMTRKDHTAPAANNVSPKNIPGKMPITAIGKLTIEIAWKIEEGTGKHTTANIVMGKLQELASSGDDGTVVKKINEGVVWVKKNTNEQKNYTTRNCGIALITWYKSRADQ